MQQIALKFRTIEPATPRLAPARTRNPAGLFISREVAEMYPYPKEFLSVDQLVQKLIDSGIEASSRTEAIQALTTIGYYRLKGYGLQWLDPVSGKYKAGTSLTDILRLYHFDMELSRLLFQYLSQIEVTLRARLVNAFQATQDALILNDPSAFDDKKLYWKNQGTIAGEIYRSSDVFIRHHFERYHGAVPLWAAVEVMSFGTLSKVVKNLKPGNGSVFSILARSYTFVGKKGGVVAPSKDLLTSWVQAATIMRNICAHNSRIYNRTISTRPELLDMDRDWAKTQPKYNGLYQIMLAMKYLRPDDASWNAFVCEFQKLLNQYAGVYEFERMNFPGEWKKHFIV